jgi:hypothetical protein
MNMSRLPRLGGIWVWGIIIPGVPHSPSVNLVTPGYQYRTAAAALEIILIFNNNVHF